MKDIKTIYETAIYIEGSPLRLIFEIVGIVTVGKMVYNKYKDRKNRKDFNEEVDADIHNMYDVGAEE